MSYPTQLFINNELVAATSGNKFSVHNPTDDSFIAEVEAAGEADVELAYQAAKNAFKQWSSMKSRDRAACMSKLADLIAENAERLAAAETAAMGFPRSVLVWFIGEAVTSIWRYYAGWCDKIAGESYPADGDGTYSIIQHEPLGVCGAISAWNGAPVTFATKIAPCVAAGNTVIHKSSEKTPFGTLLMGDLIVKAGFPPGVINLINGDGQTGAALASHMGIAKISFTGSVGSGRKVQEAAAKSNLKHVTLELGGKSPSVIFDDADLDNALTHNADMFLMNSGQICVAGSRIFVQDTIAASFIEKLKTRFESLAQKFGDPSDPNTMYGPLADKKQYDRVMSFIAAGQEAGGSVITGGIRKGDKGCFVTPTIFLQAGPSNPVYDQEVFGPVIVVNTFKTEEEVIELANATTYGLSSYVFTSNVSRALRVASQMQAGMVNVNTSQSLNVKTPFGGYKQSGFGKEHGREGIMTYMNTKTISIKYVSIYTPQNTLTGAEFDSGDAVDTDARSPRRRRFRVETVDEKDESR